MLWRKAHEKTGPSSDLPFSHAWAPTSLNTVLPVPFLRHFTQIRQPKSGLTKVDKLRQYINVIRNSGKARETIKPSFRGTSY